MPARLRSLWRPGRVPMVDAHTVLRGTGDAIAVLVLRSVRTSSWLVLAIGLIIAWVTGQATRIAELNTVTGLVDSLRTPLVVVACGLVIRFLLAPAAWLLAFRAMMRVPHGGDLPAGTGLTWTDVMRTADGWRALRWTLDVRRQAVEQLGDLGQVLRLAETALRFATGLAFALFILLVGR